MSEVHESGLYVAASNALASDASAENTWTHMAKASFPHMTAADFMKELNEVEAVIKKEYGITSMPNPWRSSKSIILNAMRLKVNLCDANGVLLGKTAIQDILNALKDPSTALELGLAALRTLSSHFDACDAAQKKTLASQITAFALKC